MQYLRHHSASCKDVVGSTMYHYYVKELLDYRIIHCIVLKIMK